MCNHINWETKVETAVLDPFCRSHDVPNLYLMDSSFFPSSAAMNPALTIASQALRVGETMMHQAGQGVEA